MVGNFYQVIPVSVDQATIMRDWESINVKHGFYTLTTIRRKIMCKRLRGYEGDWCFVETILLHLGVPEIVRASL